MDLDANLQAVLALRGIKIQNITPVDVDNGHILQTGVIVTFEYKWVTASRDVRWEHGFVSCYDYTLGDKASDDRVAAKVVKAVDSIRETLRGHNPEVL